MYVKSAIGIAALLALTVTGTVAASSAPGTTGGSEGSGAAGGALADYGEDPARQIRRSSPRPSARSSPRTDDSWNIILAAIARANQDLDQATIDKAMECWSAKSCDTGSGGDLVMGYADGGGDTVNVWRSVSHMEAILQALTYPEIGRSSRPPPTSTRTRKCRQRHPVPGPERRRLHRRLPRRRIALAGAVSEAEAAGVPYLSFSAGYVGLPGQEGALVPGEDYTSVIGEDLCALGKSFADVLNTGVGSGEVAMLGGTPGNALTLGWQQCAAAALADGVDLVNPPADANSTTGDTYWVNTMALDAVRGLLTTNPDIKGWAYEYADGLYTALQAYDELGIPVKNLTVALRTDEQTLFCDWVDRAEPTYNIWYSAGGNFQSRVA